MSTARAATAEQVAASPKGRTEIRIVDESGQANFALKFKRESRASPSIFGLCLDKGDALARGLKRVDATTRTGDEPLGLVVGKTRQACDRHAMTTVEFLQTGGMQGRLENPRPRA